MPTAVQLPGDGHDTEVKNAASLGLASEGGLGDTPPSHTPAVSVTSDRPPFATAVQLPAGAHDTEPSSRLLDTLSGGGTPPRQLPETSASSIDWLFPDPSV